MFLGRYAGSADREPALPVLPWNQWSLHRHRGCSVRSMFELFPRSRSAFASYPHCFTRSSYIHESMLWPTCPGTRTPTTSRPPRTLSGPNPRVLCVISGLHSKRWKFSSLHSAPGCSGNLVLYISFRNLCSCGGPESRRDPRSPVHALSRG